MSDDIVIIMRGNPFAVRVAHFILAADEIESLRAQVAALTAERNRLSELWGESQAEIARVKALVADAPVVAHRYRIGGNNVPWRYVDGDAMLSGNPLIEREALIARPNLEQKP